MQLFAVQILRGESPRDVAALVLRRASEVGASCQTLEVLDTLELGTRQYARLRSDLYPADMVLEGLYSVSRSVILTASKGGHPVRQTGRVGVVPFGKMQVVPRTTMTFRGVSVPHWERQFLP